MNNIKFIICMAVLIGVNGFYSSDLLAKNFRDNDSLLIKGKSALVGDYQRRIRNQEMALQNKIDKKLIKALDNLENDPKAAEAALENLANKAVQADGIKGDVDIELYNSDTMTPEQLAEVEVLGEKYGKDEFGGFYDPKSGKIYLNASKLDGTRSQVSGILANELTHYVDHKKEKPFNQQRQDLSTEQQQNMVDQFAGYNGEESVSLEERASFQDSIKKQDFSEGNVNASRVETPYPYEIRTGTVETGDTLTSITKEVNSYYGTGLTNEQMAKINSIKNLDEIKAGDIIQVGTISQDGTTWKPPKKPDGVNEQYWESLNPDQQFVLHYHRRVFEDTDLPKTASYLKSNEDNLWKKTFGDAPAHNIGTEGNIDMRGTGSRSGQQAIYDKNGNLVTTPKNAGSFDYVSPPNDVISAMEDALFKDSSKANAHLKVDVAPWIEYGNSPQDTSTRKQRLEAMGKTKLGREGLKRLGYSYDQASSKWFKKN